MFSTKVSPRVGEVVELVETMLPSGIDLVLLDAGLSVQRELVLLFETALADRVLVGVAVLGVARQFARRDLTGVAEHLRGERVVGVLAGVATCDGDSRELLGVALDVDDVFGRSPHRARSAPGSACRARTGRSRSTT